MIRQSAFQKYFLKQQTASFIHSFIHACMHACMHTYMHTYIHTYIHTDIQTYRHTDIQTYRHTDRQTDRHIHACMHAYIHIYIYILHIHTWKKAPSLNWCFSLPFEWHRTIVTFSTSRLGWVTLPCPASLIFLLDSLI